jgi:hypothetical protein
MSWDLWVPNRCQPLWNPSSLLGETAAPAEAIVLRTQHDESHVCIFYGGNGREFFVLC